MKPFASAALQSFLEAELRAGAKIVEETSAPNWGDLKRLIILDSPFKTESWKQQAKLIFRDLHDPHYWHSEVEDSATKECVACRFVISKRKSE